MRLNTEHNMDLSIIIVNWNSAAFVKKCLESVYANADGLDYEIVVIDNGTFDHCREVVRAHFPAVRFIQSDTNLGFSGANNLASKTCRGRNLLFLNPDTEIVGPALQTLVSFLDSTPAAGIAGPKLLNTDLSIQTSCIQRFPTILNQVFDSEALRSSFPKSSFWGTRPLLIDSTPVKVEVIVGACLMIKASVFSQIGCFHSDYFMYAEDVDLCFSARQAGWKSFYVPASRVVHHGGGSSDNQTENHFAAIVMRESVLKFFARKRGRVYAALFRSATAAAALCRVGLLAILVPFARNGHRLSRRVALRRWIKLFRWAIGGEKWASQLGRKNDDKDEIQRRAGNSCYVAAGE